MYLRQVTGFYIKIYMYLNEAKFLKPVTKFWLILLDHVTNADDNRLLDTQWELYKKVNMIKVKEWCKEIFVFETLPLIRQ